MSNAFLNPRALQLPLRDLARGVRQHGGPVGLIIARALEGLPGPLRDVVDDIAPFGSESGGTSSPLSANTIAQAAAAMRGGDISSVEMAACSSFAISVLLAESPEPEMLVSETLLALCWRDAETKPFRAAAFLHAMTERAPFSYAPGLVSPGQPPTSGLTLQICIGTVLWLLAEPDNGKISENELVRISGWLAAGSSEACKKVWDDPKALNAILFEVSERI